MEEVVGLVIGPFGDIVEKSKAAVANARDCELMLDAGQKLLKEGERALKCLEPLCQKHHEEYGFNFVNAVKENEEISKHLAELNDLLWEFDDYTETNNFDADKYAQLQAMSRKTAPRLRDIIMRMKLEPLASSINQDFLAQMSPPSSPLFQQAPLRPRPLKHTHSTRCTARSSEGSSRVASAYDEAVEEAVAQLGHVSLDRDSNSPQEPCERVRRVPAIEPEAVASVQPLRPCTAGRWELNVSRLQDYDQRSARYSYMTGGCESPVDPIISPLSRVDVKPSLSWHRMTASSSGGSDYDCDSNHCCSDSVYSSSSVRSQLSRPRVLAVRDQIPEEELPESEDKTLTSPPSSQYDVQPPPLYSPAKSFFDTPRRLSGESAASVGDGGLQQLIVVNNNRHSSATHRTSTNSVQQQQQLSPTCPTQPLQTQTALDTQAPIVSMAEFESGLIPVETEFADAKMQETAPFRDSTIGPKSSFAYHHGFCQGAKEVVRGAVGVKRTHRPAFNTLTRSVARCTSCLYQLDFEELELDLNKHAQGRLTKSGIDYRLRFLQKSHLPAKRVDDVQYGCVFCLQQGHTLDESDATVFFTTKALFSHLARHPRPLPKVEGITVVEGVKVPESLQDNYDVHFKYPPIAHIVHKNDVEIIGRPSGIAREQARRIYGQRMLYDRSLVLELAKGAKVTGIEWPAKYKGEWMFAWHDGVFAAVPSEIIKLNSPPTADIKLAGTSSVRAKTRWKFVTKDKEHGDWLRFDKNEVIGNISWAYPEHWCWSGTNARGKWGIFPRVFIDESTLEQGSADCSRHVGWLSMERKRASTVLSKLSVRKTSGRPPSMADSSSSRETTAPRWTDMDRNGSPTS
ncbi:hypothetical protein CDD81_1238 [Ophiocordyceps australis]|uniref:SH3 domain-containing protein n=1 Tax=Ophiocordyceps australis TaxID=1399860 RepID=A0A2C5XBA9_9HYPO|nr:hypothetical protein CDD81_1238 [Ophiocordyceps australis]